MSSDVDRHVTLSDIGVYETDVPKAQRAAGRNARDEAELREFLHMLGVFPGQENPVVVKKPRGTGAP